MNNDPGQQIQVKVHHSNGQKVSVPLNLGDLLQDARHKLQVLGVMTENDNFVHDGAAVLQSTEGGTSISAILNQRDELNIGVARGAPTGADSIDVTFDDLDANQKITLLDDVNAFKGLTFKKEGGVAFVPTFKKLFKFAGGYIPEVINPPEVISDEDFISFSEEMHSLQTSGVDSASVSLTTPWVGLEAEYERAKQKSKSSSTVRTYQTHRLVHTKILLSAGPNGLIIEDEFADILKRAVVGVERSIDACQNLVHVLNEYGWYIPIEYALGGAVYCRRISNSSSFEQMNEARETFKQRFSAQVMSFGAGAGVGKEAATRNTDMTRVGTDSLTFSQIGGAYFAGTSDYTSWSLTLNNPKTWRIIEYRTLYPSLLLLRGNDRSNNDTLQTCINLLRTYREYKQVTDLQKFINIGKYELIIAGIVNPIYD